MKPDQLTISPEAMRRFGYQVIDLLVDHIRTLPERPVGHKAQPDELAGLIDPSLPQHGLPLDRLLEELNRDVFSNILHLDHPRFFAYIPSPSNFMGIMADTLSSGFNVFAGTWLEASGPAQVELIVLDWLRTACGLPSQAGGLFVSGGSMANLTALAVARQIKVGVHDSNAVVYFSDQTHSSVDRALTVLGFVPAQVRRLKSDLDFRLKLDTLQNAVKVDREAGRLPFCVVANAGTTNTGAVDPLPELSSLCKQEELWLHLDGAYGAAAVFSPLGKAALAGLEQADSISLDPHKWLFQPYEIGCLLVRDRSLLQKTFRILPEYLEDLAVGEGEINFCDYGIQLTRQFRALKLWLSFKTFGVEGFEKAIRRGIQLAEFAQASLEGMSDWEVVTPAQLGILTFRFVPPGISPEMTNALQRQLIDALIHNGFGMISSTVLGGEVVLRMCTINPRTREDDIQQTIHLLDEIGQRLYRDTGSF